MIEIVSAPQLHADIGKWVNERIKGDGWRGFNDGAVAIGFTQDGKPIGGIVYYDYTGCNILAAIAVEDGRALSRRCLRAIFEYPFVQLDCLRMTALICSRNTKSVDFCERLGFKYEGTLRRATPTDDLLVFGLIKEECRWINSGK